VNSPFTNPIKKKQYLLITVDAAVIFSAIVISYVFRVKFYEGRELLLVGERLSWVILPMIIIHILVFYVFELYEIRKRLYKVRAFLTITLAVVLAAGVLSGLFYLFPKYKFGRVVLITYVPTAILGIAFWRLLFSKILHNQIRDKNLLFIGSNAENQFLIKELKRYPVKEYNLIGVMCEHEDGSRKTIAGVPIVGKGLDLEGLVKDRDIKAIVISSNSNAPPKLMRSALNAKVKGVAIYDTASFYKELTGKVPIFHIKELWLLFISGIGALGHPYYRRVKSLMDVVLSTAFLVLASPIMFCCAVVLKIESKGPIFFKQERLGLNQKPFNLLKFRTMLDNAESETGPVWAKKNDPRVTRAGRFLRRTRLDELPQFINVLKGDMSIIGPRPIRKIFEDEHIEKTPYYFLRYSTKPGITGWAQTRQKNPRAKEGPIERLQYDLFYIQEASLFLDLLIILKTIQTVLLRPSE
jgi:exopolysaccharide biosynthesis polyprenyl glycosylphosphotransferase